ncbi:hypothetical protein [Schaedlerella arabinosiphila]|uniref:hypothetical protein n=1 Tax=Schaedlerella arabinosiphila TaxID=2044587 RepID=UPI0002CAFF5A|nr:hypothetical protein C824_005642 [Schaedlerella arabinosiphila]KAI4443750.1 hypothetical protein C824_006286 [Schaedlerella arabinosiphila]
MPTNRYDYAVFLVRYGSFTGKLISGMGLFAKALKERGIKVIDVEEVESFNLLDCPQLQSI